MITKCYSYSGNCPCVDCDMNCCEESTDEHDWTDTEKLCAEARKYCEACAIAEGE